MNMPFALPDWVPWWVPLVLLVPALLYGLAFLFMPFSVLGVKTRLEIIEARLDEIQQEIRHVALRLPMGPQAVDFEDVYAPVTPVRQRESSIGDRPPIPPAVQDLYDDSQARRREPSIGDRPPIPLPAQDLHSPQDLYDDDDPVERPAPPPNMRPLRRDPQVVRPQRSEPRLDGRR
jgi:hypothetical protein